MQFILFTVWTFDVCFGFSLLEIDTDREDETTFALLGFYYDKEDRELQIDFFWKIFTFNFKKQIS